jgi:hypothetical protein
MAESTAHLTDAPTGEPTPFQQAWVAALGVTAMELDVLAEHAERRAAWLRQARAKRRAAHAA